MTEAAFEQRLDEYIKSQCTALKGVGGQEQNQSASLLECFPTRLSDLLLRTLFFDHGGLTFIFRR